MLENDDEADFPLRLVNSAVEPITGNDVISSYYDLDNYIHTNFTDDDDDDRAANAASTAWSDRVFFDRVRFAADSGAAAFSTLLNGAVLVTLCLDQCRHNASRPTKTVYRCLFVNLMLANTLSSLTSWLGNNMLFLAPEFLSSGGLCAYLVYVAAAFFISTTFGLASVMTVLGFAIVQYYAICRPLENMTVVNVHATCTVDAELNNSGTV